VNASLYNKNSQSVQAAIIMNLQTINVEGFLKCMQFRKEVLKS